MHRMIAAGFALMLAGTMTGGSAAQTTAPADTRAKIRIAGSSTIRPYALLMAGAFVGEHPQVPMPTVDGGGTAAGLRAFCKGVGPDTVDIAAASRPIEANELEACRAAGVTGIAELKIGYDAVVFATGAGGVPLDLTPADWFGALSARVVKDGQLLDNPNRTWADVRGGLPASPIAAVIPGPEHGTREVFDRSVLLAGCRATGTFDIFKAGGMDDGAADQACLALRADGAVRTVDGDYSETLDLLDADRFRIGVFGLAFYENNRDKLQAAKFEGVAPNAETVADGRYKVSRPLYLYVKKAHLEATANLRAFLAFVLSDAGTGPGSRAAEKGLVPGPDAERAAVRAAFAAGKVL